MGARINSRVASVSGKATGFSSDGAPLKIRLRRVERRMAKDEKTVCARWDGNAAEWSADGCALVDEVSFMVTSKMGNPSNGPATKKLV